MLSKAFFLFPSLDSCLPAGRQGLRRNDKKKAKMTKKMSFRNSYLPVGKDPHKRSPVTFAEQE